ncbi:MAG: hypothetical protein IT385_18420 [Deltaproteobacteria bacterium]|nr:hypothetical protein [Deltaproteobacteria bacterium]
MSRPALPSLVSALTALTLMAAAPTAAGAEPDAVARVLAGLGGKDSPVGDTPAEKAAIARFGKLASDKWAYYMKHIGTPMAAWAKGELARAPGETIFYPFAGPDLPTAVQLYPDAGRYVLVALQTGGRVPDLQAMDGVELDQFLDTFGRGWTDFARRGFFRTDDLKADTGSGKALEGITPVLMAFASASGFTVDAVEPIRIKADGSDVETHPGPRDDMKTWDSVRLTMRRADGARVLLDYLWLDLSDDYLKKNDAARTWLGHVAGNKVFTKAASHLMQKSFFSIVRDTLIAKAPLIVQDETGIAYKDLVKRFDVTLYGRFQRAHKLWTEGVQRELATAYKTRKDIRPLKFKFGYEKDAGSCIQVAIRKAN